jgi:hypothetical protein
MAVAMAAMGASNEIVVSQSRDSSHGHCFLPRVEVGRALNQVTPQQVVDFVLERPDLPHLPQEVEGLPFIEVQFL